MTNLSPPRMASIWVWPAVAIVLIAVSGYVFGLLGSIIAAGATCAALLFTAAEVLALGRGRHVAALLAAIGVVAISTVFAMQGALPWSRPVAAPPSLIATGPVDLRGRRPTPTELASSDLRGALMAGADLSSLDLRNRPFSGATASGAALRGSDLSNADLSRVDLRGADLTGACLVGTALDRTDLSGAIVTGASVAVPRGQNVVGTPLAISQRARSCQ